MFKFEDTASCSVSNYERVSEPSHCTGQVTQFWISKRKIFHLGGTAVFSCRRLIAVKMPVDVIKFCSQVCKPRHAGTAP